MDYRLNLIAGTDLPVPECQLAIHQPTIRELSYIGEETFRIGAQYLCVNKNMLTEDESDLLNQSNFQIFMTIMASSEAKDKKDQVLELLKLLLPNHNCMLTPRSIICSSGGATFMIDDSNFEPFQDAISEVFCLRSGMSDQQIFNPQSEKAKEIAAKLMRGRQRVAAQKGEDNSSVISQYISVLAIGMGVPLPELLDLTLFQLYDQIQRYNMYVAWDLDVRARLAGGKPDGEPDNWMKSIH